MLDLGMDINSKDNNGNTVLKIACIHKNQEIINLLIDYGALIDKIYKNGGDIVEYIFEGEYNNELKIKILNLIKNNNLWEIHGKEIISIIFSQGDFKMHERIIDIFGEDAITQICINRHY